MEDLEPGALEVAFRPFGDRRHIRVSCVQTQQMYVERRDRPGPDNAVCVVALLDHGRDGARDADTVAAHYHRLAGTALVEIVAAHRFRVFRSELEHLPDFDAPEALVLPSSTTRTAIPFNGYAQVEEAFELLEIAIRLESEMVIALLVGPGRQVERALQAAIDVDGNVEIDGADEPRRRS